MKQDDYWKLPLEQYFIANAIIRWRRVGIRELDRFELQVLARQINWKRKDIKKQIRDKVNGTKSNPGDSKIS